MSALCPTCGGAVAAPWTGRPRVYCGDQCRHEMARLRVSLGYLEAQLADARRQLDWHKGVQRERYVRELAALEPRVLELRERVRGVLGRSA